MLLIDSVYDVIVSLCWSDSKAIISLHQRKGKELLNT